MNEKHGCKFRFLLKRVVAYGVLLVFLLCVVHVYVTKTLYIKKLPYYSKVFWARFDVSCESNAPYQLKELLADISLPYFSLEGGVAYIGKDGDVLSCQVPGNKINDDSLFRFASMTKVVTSIAMIDLAQHRNIDLDTEVLEFFPEVNPDQIKDPNVREVTLNHLLNHSSGLGGPFGSDNMVEKNERPWCPYDIKMLESVRLAGEPGSNHLYSNVAYCLLGEVISRLTGMEFQQYINETYLSEYRSLRFVEGGYVPGEPEYDFSNEYRFKKDYVDWLDFHALSSSAGLIGNPKEFALLVRDLMRKHPDILQATGVEGCEERGLERCYSYAFVRKEGKNGEVVGVQQGYLPGASSLVAVTADGQVLVWVAAGAALESKHKDLMVDKVVSFLTRD